MIIFDLACSQNHRFEGWFASADEFAVQSERGLVRCPVCDSAEVVKRPSAVAFHGATSSQPPTEQSPAATETEDRHPVAQALPAEIVNLQRELLTKMRQFVRETEDVGNRFAEEARKIHYQEAKHRNIRGRATPQEADELREEGIEFHALPGFLVDEVH